MPSRSAPAARPAAAPLATVLLLAGGGLGLGLALAARAADPGTPPTTPAGPAAGTALGTGFTYQGELSQAGALVDGTFAMDFTLWDAPGGGGQLGPTVSRPAVAVTGGRFTVPLDFGVDALRGGPRWLEVTVDGFTLAPRQPVSAAPFALRTRGIDVDGAGNVGIGAPASTGSSRLRVWKDDGVPGTALEALSDDGTAVAAVRQQGGGAAVTALHWGDGGTGVRAVSGDGGRTGELAAPDAAVRGVAPAATDWAAWFEGRGRLGDRAFVGREAAVTGAEFFGVRAPVTGSAYGGMYVSTDGPGTRPFYGYAPDGLARAWTTFEGATDTWRVFIGGQPRFDVDADGPRTPGGVRMPLAAISVAADGTITGGAGDVTVQRFDGLGGTSYIVSFPEGSLGVDAVVQATPTGFPGPDPVVVPAYLITLIDEDLLTVSFLDVATGDGVPRSFSLTVWPAQ